MKIAILTAGFPPERIGGAETQAANVAALLARRHQVTVFTRSNIKHCGRQPNYRVRRRTFIDIPFIRFPLDVITTLFFLTIYKKDIDLILAYQAIIDGFIAVIAKIILDIPAVVSIRTDKEYHINAILKARLLSPFVLRHADKILVQSEKISHELLEELAQAGYSPLGRLVEEKIRTIPNGITLRPTSNASGKAVLYVGRLVKKKGVQYLILAMRECPDKKLLIVGDGPEMARLRRAARGMENVHFVGQIPAEEVSHYMRQAQLLVLPSLGEEGTPNVILEAMAEGVPAIATRVAGIPDLIKHGETGFLIGPGSAGEIAFYIKTIASDASLRAGLRKKCLSEIQRYSWSRVLPLLEKELKQVAKLKGKNGAATRSW